MSRILLVALLLASCARTPSIERQRCARPECATDGECEPSPAGDRVTIGNDPKFSVCIKADPANTDATCEPYAAQLRDRGGNRAVLSCIEEHRITCEKKTCRDTCRNTAVLVEGGGVHLRTEPVECAKTEHACRLDITSWQCECACQLEL